MRFSIASAAVGAVLSANVASAATCGINSIPNLNDCVDGYFKTNFMASDTAFGTFLWESTWSEDEANKFATKAEQSFTGICSGTVDVNLSCDDQTTSTSFSFSDDSDPVIHGLFVEDITVEYGDVPIAPIGVTGYDACWGTVNVVKQNDVVNGNVSTRQWIATDGCNNQTTRTQYITEIDSTPPVFLSVPENITTSADNIPAICQLEHFDWDPSVQYTTSQVPETYTFDPASCSHGTEIIRTWTIKDTSNNTSTHTQTITLEDNDGPEFKVEPENITVNCNTIPPSEIISAVDALSGAASGNLSNAPNSTIVSEVTSSIGQVDWRIVREWIAWDSCLNDSTVTQTIDVVDNTPPTITLFGDATVECDIGSSTLLDICEPAAFDECNTVSVKTSYEDTPTGTCGQEYKRVLTHRATDQNDNVTTEYQTIIIDDSTPPAFDVMVPNLTVECIENVNYLVECEDNCDASCTVSLEKNASKWTYTASDSCGNSATQIATITVVDGTPPTLVNVPSNETVSCSMISDALLKDVSALDNCSGVGSVIFSEATQPLDCFENYNILRSWTVSDIYGNSAVSTQTIEVRDTSPPQFVGLLESDKLVNCESIPVSSVLTYVDDCLPSHVQTVTFTENTTNVENPNKYKLERKWVVSDGCSNSITHEATVSVQDVTPPSLVVPASYTQSCEQLALPQTPDLEAERLALMNLDDNCSTGNDITVSASWTKVDDNCDHKFSYVAAYTAEDQSGNISYDNFTVSYSDSNKPTIDCSALNGDEDLTLEYDDTWTNAFYDVTPVVNDTCDSGVTLETDHSTVSMPCANESKIVRKWYAKDDCGNKSETTCVQTITVLDNIAPIITSNLEDIDDITLQCSDQTGIDNLPQTVAFCDPTDEYSSTSGLSGSCAPLTTGYTRATPNYFATEILSQPYPNTYTTKNTWTVKDACDTSSSHVQTVIIEDTTNCSIDPSEVANREVILSAVTEPSVLVPVTSINVTDNCDSNKTITGTINYTTTGDDPMVLLTPSSPDNDHDPTTYYQLTQVFSTTDSSNNPCAAKQTILVKDMTPPSLTCPPNYSNQCDSINTFGGWQHMAGQSYSDFSADSIGAGGLFITNRIPTDHPEACGNNGYIEYQDEVIDVNGQVTRCTFKQTYLDDTPPTLTPPSDTTVECFIDPVVVYCTDNNDATVGCVSPTVGDNCDLVDDVTYSMTTQDVNVMDAATKIEYKDVWEWVASDVCGNKTTMSHTTNWKDTTPPSIPAMSDITTNTCVPGQTESAVNSAFSATDACDLSVTIEPNHTIPTYCNDNRGTFSASYSWKVTDNVGNFSVGGYTDSFTDNEKPTLVHTVTDVTQDYEDYKVLSATYHDPAANITPQDNCTEESDMVVNCTRSVDDHTCTYAFTYNYTCSTTDNCGTASDPFVRNITIEDNTPPIFDPAFSFQAITVDCTNGNLVNGLYTPADVTAEFYHDDVTAGLAVQVIDKTDDSSNADFTSNSCQILTYGYYAEDDCGNFDSRTLVVTVEDITPPTITGCDHVGGVTMDCEVFLSDTDGSDSCIYADNCAAAGDLIVNYDEYNDFDGCEQEYDVERSYVVTDPCGNLAEKDITFLVTDITPPVVSIPDPNVTLDGSSAYPDVSTLLTDCEDVVIDEACGSCISASEDCATGSSGGGGRRLLGFSRAELMNFKQPTVTSMSFKRASGEQIEANKANLEDNNVNKCIYVGAVNFEADNLDVTFIRLNDSGRNGQKLIKGCHEFCEQEAGMDGNYFVGFSCPSYLSEDDYYYNQQEPYYSQEPYFSQEPYYSQEATEQAIGNSIDCFCVPDSVVSAHTSYEVDGYSCSTAWDSMSEMSTGYCSGLNVGDRSNLYVVDNFNLGGENYLSLYPSNSGGNTNMREANVGNVNSFVSSTKFSDFVDRLIIKKDQKTARGFVEQKPDFNTDYVNFKDNFKAVVRRTPNKVPLVADPINNVVACEDNSLYVQKWTIKNSKNLSTTQQRTITYQDLTPPQFSNIPAENISVQTDEIPVQVMDPSSTNPNRAVASNGQRDYNVSASDFVKTGSLEITFTEETLSQDNENEFVLLRKWSTEDNCGNETTIKQTVTVSDDKKNEILNVPVNCDCLCDSLHTCPNPDSVVNDWQHWADTDAELKSTNETIDDVCDGTYKFVYHWTSIDRAGNEKTADYTISVTDTSPPVFSGTILTQNTRTVKCPENYNAGAFHEDNTDFVDAEDNCDNSKGALVYNEVEEGQVGACKRRTIKRTWTATDTCGQSSSVVETVTIIDNTPPVITDVPVNHDSDCVQTPYTNDEVTVKDTCSDSVNIGVKHTVTTESQNCEHSLVVRNKWVATDECGNNSEETTIDTVLDNAHPVLTVPGDDTKECSLGDKVDVDYLYPSDYSSGFVANDICSTSVDVNSISSGAPFLAISPDDDCQYHWKKRYSVSDDCGQTTTKIQAITILDNVPPMFDDISLIVDTTVECHIDPQQTTLIDALKATITATDACSGARNVNVTKESREYDINNSPNCTNEYTQPIRLDTADECGLTYHEYIYRVVEDNTDPHSNSLITLVASGAITKDCSEISTYAPPVITDGEDNCAVIPTLNAVQTSDDPVDDYTFSRTYQYNLNDICGNTESYDLTVNFRDITPPTINDSPVDLLLDCKETKPQPSISASDNCDTNVTVAPLMYDEYLGESCAAEKAFKQTWTATDESGNISSKVRIVKFDDSTKPTFDNSNRFVHDSAECQAVPSFADETFSDNCSNVTYIGGRDDSDRDFVDYHARKSSEYTLVDTYQITDDCGNQDSYSRTIDVVDLTPPSLSVPYTNEVLELNNNLLIAGSHYDKVMNDDTMWLNALDHKDTCSDTTVKYTMTNGPLPGTCGHEMTKIQTWIASDAVGNTTTETRTMTVTDTISPHIDTPANDIVDCQHLPVSQSITGSDGGNNFVGSALTVAGSQSAKLVEEGKESHVHTYSIVNMYTASDICGKSTTTYQTINVRDITPPVFSVTDPNNGDAVVTSNDVLTPVCDQANPLSPLDVKVSDNCVSNQSYSPEIFTLTPEVHESARTKYTYTATDEDFNTTTFNVTIAIIDSTPPTLVNSSSTQYANDLTYECHEMQEMAVDTTASDDCDVSVVAVRSHVDRTALKKDLDPKVVLATEFTWTATDMVGNITSSITTLTVRDTTPPTVVMGSTANHSTIENECDDVHHSTIADVQLDDSCVMTKSELHEGMTVYTNSVVCINAYKLVTVYDSTDDNGNYADFTRTINVSDNSAPVVNAYTASSTSECDVKISAPSMSVTDNCDFDDGTNVRAMDLASTTGSPDGNYNYTLTYNYSVVDACGKATTASVDYLVSDNTPPSINMTSAPNKTLAIFDDSNFNPNNVYCEDNCSTNGELTVTSSQSFVEIAANLRSNDACYKHEVVYECSDADNNKTTSPTQIITVEDQTPPVIVGACNILQDNFDSSSGKYIYEYNAMPIFADVRMNGVYATDFNGDESGISADVNVSVKRVTSSTANPHVYTEEWEYVAVDYCLNETIIICEIEAVDTTGPPLPEIEDITAECDAIPNACNMLPLGSDDEDVNLGVSFTEATENVNGNNYTLKRTWTVTDAANNTTSRVQLVDVSDNTPPVLSRYPVHDTVPCDCGLPDAGDIIAIDNCDASVSVNSQEVENFAGLGGKETMTITRAYSAVDANGNLVYHEQYFSVVDNEAPRFFPSVSGSISVECDHPTGANLDVIAMDNCDSALPSITIGSANVDHPTQDCDEAFQIDQTWSITDNKGNVKNMSRAVIVSDNHAPEPGNAVIPLQCIIEGSGTSTATSVFGDFDFYDYCGSVQLVGSCTGGSTYNSEQDTLSIVDTPGAVYSCSVVASDSCGNSSSSVQRTYKVVADDQAFAEEGCASLS